MGRRCKPSNYRQLYKNRYGIDFGAEMAVHHIDFDRSNNDIDNLLLMPKGLLAKYNFCLNALGAKAGVLNLDCKIALEGNGYERAMLRNLVDALDEIDKWRIEKVETDMMNYWREYDE